MGECHKLWKTDLVEFSTTEKPECIVEVSARAGADLIAQARSEALAFITKTASLPGFRKGKAPKSLIEQRFPEALDSHTREHLVPLVLTECVKTADIPFLEKEQILSGTIEERIKARITAFSPTSAELQFSLETEPNIPLIDPSAIELEPIPSPVIDKAAVDEAVRQALFFYSDWVAVEGRGAQEGDFITLSGHILEGSDAGPLFEHVRFEITDKHMAAWMKEAVLGRQVGESVRTTSIPDADVPEEEKAFYPAQPVEITIEVLEQPIYPEVNASLLEKLKVASMEEFEQYVEKQLTEEATTTVLNKQIKQVSERLIAMYSFPLPSTYIQIEMQHRWQQVYHTQEMQTFWQSATQEMKQSLLSLMKSRSIQGLQLYLLCAKFLKHANIPTESRSFSPDFALRTVTEYIVEHAREKAHV